MPLLVHRFLVLTRLPEVLLAKRCADVFELDDTTKRISGAVGLLLSTCFLCLLSPRGGGGLEARLSGDQKRQMQVQNAISRLPQQKSLTFRPRTSYSDRPCNYFVRRRLLPAFVAG